VSRRVNTTDKFADIESFERDLQVRDYRVARDYAKGWTQEALARKYKLSQPGVVKLLRRVSILIAAWRESRVNQ